MATYEEKDLVRIFGDAYLEYKKEGAKVDTELIFT